MGGRKAIRGTCLVLSMVFVVGMVSGAGCVATPVVADESKALQDLRLLVARFDGKPSSGDLQSFEASHPNTRAGNLARFLRGYLASDAGDWGSALAALDHTTIARSTSVGDYALLYRGRAEAKLGRYKEAEETLEHVHEKYPESLVARDASLEAAKIAMAIGAETDFNHDIQPLLDAYDGDALVLMAQQKATKGDTPGAIRYYRMAYYFDPSSAAAASAATALGGLGVDVKTASATEQELRARANKLFAEKAYSPAKDAYTLLLSSYPNVKDRDEMNLNRGIAAGATRDVTMATASLTAISEGNKQLHAHALYQLATAYRLAGQGPQFESTGSRLRTLYPKSDWTGKYLGDLAELLEAKSRIPELLTVQRALISGFPENEKAAEASYDLAWLAYRTHDYSNAAQLFTEHLATFRTPTTKWVGEAAFWGARAWENVGNKARALLFYDLARQRYPYGYHGHVAGNRARDLQRRTPNLKAEEPPVGSPVAAARINALSVKPLAETSDQRAEPRIARASDFKAIRLFDLAIRELTAAQTVFPDSPMVNLRLAQVYFARGDNYQATLILRKGYPDIYSYKDEEIPREAWEVMFPLAHWETIKQQASAQNIDPFIIAGLIRQESVFNAKAISRANARGLMQVLPSTGRLIAKSSGLGAVGPADLYTPSVNISLGTAYFAQQYRNFGRVEFAAAAYNAGPGRVVQWKAARPGDPIEEWVENIPFKETRGYVMGVLRYAANYRRFYGKGDERGDQEW
jgi:soluble lytic murein transglycosylase